jgi:hypothetical protein
MMTESQGFVVEFSSAQKRVIDLGISQNVNIRLEVPIKANDPQAEVSLRERPPSLVSNRSVAIMLPSANLNEPKLIKLSELGQFFADIPPGHVDKSVIAFVSAVQFFDHARQQLSDDSRKNDIDYCIEKLAKMVEAPRTHADNDPLCLDCRCWLIRRQYSLKLHGTAVFDVSAKEFGFSYLSNNIRTFQSMLAGSAAGCTLCTAIIDGITMASLAGSMEDMRRLNDIRELQLSTEITNSDLFQMIVVDARGEEHELDLDILSNLCQSLIPYFRNIY